MKQLLSKVKPVAKSLAITVAQNTVGKIPPSPERLTGKLARDGGLPVRNTRFRPWPRFHQVSEIEWRLRVEPVLKTIFRRGAEGIPQRLSTEFSTRWAAFCDARYGLLLPHGTDALRLALAAALELDGLEYGGEVIVPNLSFVASATAALDRRMGVALVDVDPVTLNLDPVRVEEAIVPGKTRAIMPVHLFGQPADMRSILEIARRHSLVVIEDAAQAHGAIHAMGRVGSLGDAAGFSFQAFKNLPSGEGGALTTNDARLYDRAHSLQNAGRARVGGERWGHEILGWNCRPTEYVAAVLLYRLQKLEQQQETRHQRFLSLRRQLQDVPCVGPLGVSPDTSRHAVHMFVMRYSPERCGGLEIDDFVKAAQAEGVPLERAYSLTLAQQPAIARIQERYPDYLRVLPTPVADQAVGELIFIPHQIFLGSEEDITEIAAALRKIQMHYDATAARAANLTSPQQDALRLQQAEPLPASPTIARAEGAKRLRIGVLGAGAMGRQHAAVLSKHPRLELAGVADARFESARGVATEFGSTAYASLDELIEQGRVEAVVVATPHWQHPELSQRALQAGLHVLCEKPLAVSVAHVQEVLTAAATSKRIFGMVYQTRLEPALQYVKKLLESGELGPIHRCEMTETMWRSDAYYNSSPWRGTWKGEGGGVLLNQAPHILDRYIWLCGMPESVQARCDTSLHQIEVEDTASAILHHASGLSGMIHVSTAEAPATSRIVISCDRGRITLENGKTQVVRLKESVRERTRRDTQPMGEIANNTVTIPGGLIGSFDQLLNAYYDNFVLAVAGEQPFACPGAEGVGAVELANAFLLSSHLQKTVSLPLDSVTYQRFLESQFERTATGPTASTAGAGAATVAR